MRLRFTKMHGAGNDFVVIDGVRQSVRFTAQQLRALADRHRGVGADQILLVEAPGSAGIDFSYRIFNADGGEVEQCGNGARCFVRFVRDQGLTTKQAIRVQTLGGVIEPRLEADGRVSVDMGAAVFEPAKVPFDPGAMIARRVGEDTVWLLEVGEHTREVSVLSMGNPHAVQWVDDVDAAPVPVEGPAIEHHPAFARRVNSGFAQALGDDRIALRVWERGVGETLSCGSGACAAAVSAIRRGVARSPVEVRTRGGVLEVQWSGAEVRMTGPAVTVFEGEIELSDLR
ncbi:MAG: diaminopimelate epimerase [Burkholderiaceae bacterium]|nr:diaminopimelate epimerase [Burkholderiaceae bacterium]